MNLIIVSDLHIWSRFFAIAAFRQFLNQMPEDCELVLNGDSIDNPYMKLNPSHQTAFFKTENNLASGKSRQWLYPGSIWKSCV